MNQIILSDGTKLTGFELSGNICKFEGRVDTSVFEGKMSPVTVKTDEGETVYKHGKLITFDYDPNSIAFCERPMHEVIENSLSAKIDYLAIMTDVDIDSLL